MRLQVQGQQMLQMQQNQGNQNQQMMMQMAQMMQQMSLDGHQVLAITHLPQIASYGENHYKVYKEDYEDSTRTGIKVLNKEERITEIAQMMSGTSLTQAAIDNAKSLIENNGR